MRASMDSTRPQKLKSKHLWIACPAIQGLTCRLCDLEPDWLASLALDQRSALLHVSGSKDIQGPNGDKIATAQLAIYG